VQRDELAEQTGETGQQHREMELKKRFLNTFHYRCKSTKNRGNEE
jgi:hypothetical protein